MSSIGLSPSDSSALAGGTDRPRVAAICVTHNSRELLPDVIASLRRQSGLAEMRIVVVDSGSSDDSVEVARQLVPSSNVLRLPGNLGYAAGINRGVHHSGVIGGADVFLVLNPDITLAQDAVADLARAVLAPGGGIAAPTLRDEHGELLFSLRRRPTYATVASEALFGGPLAHRLRLPTEVLWDPVDYEGDSQIAWATGGALALSADCVRAVGLWDESYFLYDEEVDYCLRATRAGLRATHVAAATGTRRMGTGASLLAYVLIRVNRVRLMRQHHGPAVGGLVRATLLIGEALRAASGRPEARAALQALARRWDAATVVSRCADGSRSTAGDDGAGAADRRPASRPGEDSGDRAV